MRFQHQISKSIFRQSIFYALAFILLGIISFVVIYSIAFIVRGADGALDISIKAAPQQRFDIQGYEGLQIMKRK